MSSEASRSNDPALPEGSRVFRAGDARTALAAVKEAFGADAVIVTTRQIPGGLFRKALVEVVALPAAALASIRAGQRSPTRPPEVKGSAALPTPWTPKESRELATQQPALGVAPAARDTLALLEEARVAPLSSPAPAVKAACASIRPPRLRPSTRRRPRSRSRRCLPSRLHWRSRRAPACRGHRPLQQKRS